jgi:signal transduction histidine kinase
MDARPRILIVDDEPKNVELLEAILQPGNYAILRAGNGSEALALLEHAEVDLVLLDVMMPFVDGFEVVRRVRAREATKGLPIILVTALHETAERIKGIEAGCDEFITKPFDRHEVAARVKTLLRLNHYRTQVDEKEKFERIIHRMSGGLMICDPKLAILRSNQRAREFLGLADDTAGWLDRLGLGFRVAHYGDLRRDLTAMDLEFDLERPQTAEARALILSFSSNLIRDTDGAVASVVILLHDVTAQRKDRFGKESFLSLLSDRLRQPLAVGMGKLRALQASAGGADPAALRASVADTAAGLMEVLGMMEKIFGLLTASGAAAGKGAAGDESLDPSQVRTLAMETVGRHPGAQVTVEFNLPGGLNLPIGGEQMRIVLDNLVENAVKFSGRNSVQIVFTAAPEGERVRFTVADNGAGIPGEEQSRVFDAFYRVQRPAGAEKKGLGLGLAIVRSIVESRGGDVKVGTRAGGGAEISFSLPMARAPGGPRAVTTVQAA